MIRLILDNKAESFEADIRELVQEFYPGEDFEIHTSNGVHFTNTTQEEKNALKQAKATGEVAEVNKKSTKNRARMASEITPEGVEEAKIRLSFEVSASEMPLTGVRKEDKSVIKAELYDTLVGMTGKELPWGDLTGIRPVSLVSPMVERAIEKKLLNDSDADRKDGKQRGLRKKDQFSDLGTECGASSENSSLPSFCELTDDEIQDIKDDLTKEYCIKGEKLDLMTDIALREHRILNRISDITGRNYKEGWSLYIGIPFCPTRCLYCSFLSNTINVWEKRLGEYMENLRKEIRYTVSEMCGRFRKPLQTIYIGGGTPTALDKKWLKVLMDMVHEECGSANVPILCEGRSAAFDWRNTLTGMPGIVEFTVEAGRPDSITKEKLKILKDAGVDRISVNPQTFNQKTLDLIGRKHSVESVIEKYLLAREVGFDNINMDIILGLPGEKLPEVTHTLCMIAKYRPDSMTVHSLAIKRAARLTLERDFWAGIYRAGDENEIVAETRLQEEAEKCTVKTDGTHGDVSGDSESLDKKTEFRYPEITRMMMASSYTADLLGLKPYYLYRQKNMAGNLENVGYCVEGKECLYNILMMEEKHTVIGCGAGCSSKVVLPSKDGDPTHKRVERCDNGKDIRSYIEDVDKFIQRKAVLFELI
ncbi:coproporphyrinogen III oxidase family protein [Oribacterium sp. WCC10]|uniref:coproporphyrinogen III oxidase family protein n=1 Tax=Oribacterium sp. WCC10 TaxID=1855343 RepID=UPI0008E32609|nr:coproporphyrinogen III oxidase family protein [Oribacterium sp. WCC10]SFG54124.1 Radical SAM superfamily protein [Oribacterium sp. WCC10]